MKARTAIVFAAIAVVMTASVTTAQAGRRGKEVVQRWRSWKTDFDYLCREIDKPRSLQQIFKRKGIDWPKVRRAAAKRFAQLTKSARKRADVAADEVAFYGFLRGLIGELRDGHAGVQVEKRVHEAWSATQPRTNSTGIELLPGTHGSVVVAFVNPGDPIASRGITHEATLLVSINGMDAAKYFRERGEALLKSGGLSTLGRATMLAMHTLGMGEGEKLDLEFRILQANAKKRAAYLKLASRKRASAFAKLKWKKKKVTLRYAQCARARNPWSFHCQNAALPELKKTADERVTFGRLPSGFGYVSYTGVSKGANAALQQACVALANCPGIVLDMRRNGGGGDGGAARVFDNKNGAWRKPVAVLIGPWNMSAGETEVWQLQRLRTNHRCKMRIFGTTTAGASGDKIRWKLPSGFAEGRFVFKHWHNGQSQIEGLGCVPDVVVEQDVVELAGGVDSHVRAAETWLRRETGSR